MCVLLYTYVQKDFNQRDTIFDLPLVMGCGLIHHNIPWTEALLIHSNWGVVDDAETYSHGLVGGLYIDLSFINRRRRIHNQSFRSGVLSHCIERERKVEFQLY